MRWFRWWSITALFALAVATLGTGSPLGAASSFAHPAFQQLWQQGEAIVPNFWGPLANAKDGMQEQYIYSGTNKTRLVQYFDKGRMELFSGVTNNPNPVVTSGLLANELITGNIQTSDTTFQQQQPAAIPIAGDPDNTGPTYAQLGTTAASLLAPASSKIGGFVTVIVAADGTVTDGGGFAGISMSPAISAYDSTTQHNVLGVFADFRNKVSLASVGLAKSEPFRATVKVGGTQQSIIAQVFERRILTYTGANPDPFKVEFGNIGLHYYKWRYPTGAPFTPPPPSGGAAGDPAQAALAFLPSGYAIASVQTVDLGVEGQEQAIVIAESATNATIGEIAALLVHRNDLWALAFRTKPNENATVDMNAYPKTTAHPGFVTASYHLCGANCNSGEHTVIRWDGGGATTVVLNGGDDRGRINADIASGNVLLTGPVYRTSDPRCCPSYQLARVWKWQGGNLMTDSFNFLPLETTNALPLPQWLMKNGANLFTFLSPLTRDFIDLTAIGQLFNNAVVFTDLQGNGCTAAGPDVAKALTAVTGRFIVGLWSLDDSTYKATLNSTTQSANAPTVQAGSCTFGGAGVGGYVLTIKVGAQATAIVSVQAIGDVYKAIPDTGIQVPPT